MPTTITETTSGTKFDLSAIQSALRENKLDGWLFYDHHHRDPLAYSHPRPRPQRPRHPPLVLLHPRYRASRKNSSTASNPSSSTRCPAQNPSTPPGRSSNPGSRPSSPAQPKSPCSTPRATPSCTSPWSTPAPSNSSATSAKQIVSSADLVSHFEAVLTDEQLATHYVAQKHIDAHPRRRLEGDRQPRPQRRHRRARHGAVPSGRLCAAPI